LNICEEQKSNNDDANSKNVLPEIPPSVVCNTLFFQIIRPSNANKNRFIVIVNDTIDNPWKNDFVIIICKFARHTKSNMFESEALL